MAAKHNVAVQLMQGEQRLLCKLHMSVYVSAHYTHITQCHTLHGVYHARNDGCTIAPLLSFQVSDSFMNEQPLLGNCSITGRNASCHAYRQSLAVAMSLDVLAGSMIIFQATQGISWFSAFCKLAHVGLRLSLA